MQEVGRSIMGINASCRGVCNDEDGDVLYGALRSKRVERGSRRMEDVLLRVSWTCNSLPAQLFERVFFEQLAPRQLIDTVVTSKHAKEKDGKVKVFDFYSSTPLCLLLRSLRPRRTKVVCMHVLLTPTTPFESKYKEYLYNNRVKFARYHLHSTSLVPINQSR
jgi:hypothetical protein